MRNRYLIVLSTLALVLVLGVPAVAEVSNDNGNGKRTTYVETRDFDTELSMPICVDGARVGSIRYLPAHHHTDITISNKADWSRSEYWLVYSHVAFDGQYRTDYRNHQVVNSIDKDGTGLPNAYNQNSVQTWSDPDGVYAERTWVNHTRWDKHGNPTSDFHDTGLVCLRDTILP